MTTTVTKKLRIFVIGIWETRHNFLFVFFALLTHSCKCPLIVFHHCHHHYIVMKWRWRWRWWCWCWGCYWCWWFMVTVKAIMLKAAMSEILCLCYRHTDRQLKQDKTDLDAWILRHKNICHRCNRIDASAFGKNNSTK